jgi:alkaline phosphatase D
MDRRGFLAGLAATTAVACTSRSTDSSTTSTSTKKVVAAEPAASELPPNAFATGVASGDPLADRVIIWTRLVADPRAVGGGIPSSPVEVAFDVAEDSGFTKLVASGIAVASPDLGHSVHVDVTGLQPDTKYHYRFRAGSQTSPAGRTQTFPSASQSPDQLRFVFASCQDIQWGRFPLWQHASEEPDLNAVVFLGDYIYEMNFGDQSPEQQGERVWANKEAVTLDDYRVRYAQTNADTQLAAARAVAPWIVTFDDHEVANNYAGDVAQDDLAQPTEAAKVRRVAAYQAWYENTPIRITPDPTASTDFGSLQVYRDFTYGKLASMFTIETRQQADPPSCRTETGLASDTGPLCDEAKDPSRTILGMEQEKWLAGKLERSTSEWNIIANPIMLTELNLGTAEAPVTERDTWSGYPASRARLLDAVQDSKVANPVVVTGDWHTSYVFDVKATPDGPTVMPEFLGGSISTIITADESHKEVNPQVRYWEGKHCYAVVTVTEAQLKCEFKYVDDIWDRNAPISQTDTFVVKNGEHEAQQV